MIGPMIGVDTVYREVDDERARAHAKHGRNDNSRENAPALDREWLPILMEELGEVAHELTYDSHPSELLKRGEVLRNLSSVRKELIQVAAMACAWIDAIDRDA